MAGKAVPSTAGGGPRDFTADVHGHFAQPPSRPGCITVRIVLGEKHAGKIGAEDVSAAIIEFLARHGIEDGFSVSEDTG